MTPSPSGRGLERTAASPSLLRERVRGCCLKSAKPRRLSERRPTPMDAADPHPTGLRPATFSQREKDKISEP